MPGRPRFCIDANYSLRNLAQRPPGIPKLYVLREKATGRILVRCRSSKREVTLSTIHERIARRSKRKTFHSRCAGIQDQMEWRIWARNTMANWAEANLDMRADIKSFKEARSPRATPSIRHNQGETLVQESSHDAPHSFILSSPRHSRRLQNKDIESVVMRRIRVIRTEEMQRR